MLTLREINVMDQEQFTAALSSLFEGLPWIINEAWYDRPFSNRDHFYRCLCEVMYNAPLSQQLFLIQAHPDLVGRAALAGTLSPTSTSEQTAAGLDNLTPEEITTFQRLNQEYHARFHFPFIICARENKKESILQGFARRMQNSREEEITAALDEIAKICRLRLLDAVQEDE